MSWELRRAGKRRTSMPTPLRAVMVAVLTVAPVGAVSLGGTGTAHACSCVSIDVIDAVSMADVVFTGLAGEPTGTAELPVWHFTVDGVVKGDVEAAETVIGQNWAIGCGTDFSRFTVPIVVYARRTDDGLADMGCMPTPTAEEFAARIASELPPSGEGPPAAVLSGVIGLADLALLDSHGRTIRQGSVGAGLVTHCAGTTLVAIVPYEPQGIVNLVDLRTLELVERRPIDSGWVSIASDRIACLNEGRQVVAVTGFGPNEGSVRIATSNADGIGNDHADVGASTAVVHPAGTVILLPRVVGEPLTTLSSADLEPVAAGQIDLPDGASLIDGDVSPDGARLVMLATLSGSPVQHDTGATHILVADLLDGVPVADSLTTIELAPPGVNTADGHGAAKWIRWIDDATWVIERETLNTKYMEMVSTTGTLLFEPIDLGWGWGLAPLEDGLLRTRNGGVEVLGSTGSVTPGDPAPRPDYVTRIISVAALVNPPAFPTDAVDPIPALTITPIEVVGHSAPDTAPDTAPDAAPDATQGPTPDTARSPTSDSRPTTTIRADSLPDDAGNAAAPPQNPRATASRNEASAARQSSDDDGMTSWSIEIASAAALLGSVVIVFIVFRRSRVRQRPGRPDRS